MILQRLTGKRVHRKNCSFRGWCIEWHFWRDDRVVVFRVFPNHELFTLFFRNHFLCFLLPFFFFQVQSKIGVRIIHRHALYTGKYGKLPWTGNLQCQIHNQQTREVLQVGLNYRIPHNLCAFHCLTITSIAFGVILQKMQPGRNNNGQMLRRILQLLHKLCSFMEKKIVISLVKISHRRLCFLIQYVVNCNGWKNSF